MKANRFLSGVLVISLLWSLLWNNSSAFASGAERPRLAVLELQVHGTPSAVTQEMADRIRKELAKRGGFLVLSKQEMGTGTIPVLETAGVGLGATVERARSAYARLDFEAARRLLERALGQIPSGNIAAADNLVPAYLLLGTIHQVGGRNDEALKAFEEVVRLAPDTTLDEKKYSPRVREIFQRARQNIPAGERNVGKTVSAPSEGFTGVSVSGLQGAYEILHKAIAAGRTLKVETIVLVSAEEKGSSHQVTARVLDLNRPDSFSQETIEVSDNGRSATKGAQFLVAFLSDVGQKTATGEEASSLIAEQKAGRSSSAGISHSQDHPLKRPFWKRPLFWVIGGVILAGAGAGLGLTLGGGGGPSEVPVGVNGSAPALSR